MFAARNMTFAIAPASSYDSDAAAYFAAIVTAGSSITTANKDAVNAFIVGCKADGIWTAIKACCLLAGPDNLTGALVPLVGSAPTNNNFVSGDYSRTTGLVGDASSKYLSSNRNGNSDPNDNFHISVYVSNSGTAGVLIGSGGGNTGASTLSDTGGTRNRNTNADALGVVVSGFAGTSRSASAGYTKRINGSSISVTRASENAYSYNFFIFATNVNNSPASRSGSRISAYSIGESLDLALFDARLTTLMAGLT